MKIALSQINTICGNIRANCSTMIAQIEKAKKENLDMIVFPELSLAGYPPKDYLTNEGWRDQYIQAFEDIIQACQGIHVIFGSIVWQENETYNGAHWIDRNSKVFFQTKMLLPTWDVFDEHRYFQAGKEQNVWSIEGVKIGVTICEDLWAPFVDRYTTDPVKALVEKEASIDLLINLSASPFVANKYQTRLEIAQHHATKYQIPLLYANLVGGNDEIVFDGASFVMDHNGKCLMQAKAFESDFMVLNTNQLAGENNYSYPQDLLVQKKEAVVLGLKDFFKKSGFTHGVLGLSGGIDSALVFLLALEALGKNNITPVYMPSVYNSEISHEDTKMMCKALEIDLITLPIDQQKDQNVADLTKVLGSDLKSMTKENLQARIRGNLLMSIASEKNALVIQTGNKSEIALGYCTLYGDMVGAISPIGDLLKAEVYQMTKLLNEEYKAVGQRVFERGPSAELREEQLDTDSLPPYEVLDPIVKALVEENVSIDALIGQGFDKTLVHEVYASILSQEFKRKQAPPILKLTAKAFGFGRRMPIAKGRYES